MESDDEKDVITNIDEISKTNSQIFTKCTEISKAYNFKVLEIKWLESLLEQISIIYEETVNYTMLNDKLTDLLNFKKDEFTKLNKKPLYKEIQSKVLYKNFEFYKNIKPKQKKNEYMQNLSELQVQIFQLLNPVKDDEKDNTELVSYPHELQNISKFIQFINDENIINDENSKILNDSEVLKSFDKKFDRSDFQVDSNISSSPTKKDLELPGTLCHGDRQRSADIQFADSALKHKINKPLEDLLNDIVKYNNIIVTKCNVIYKKYIAKHSKFINLVHKILKKLVPKSRLCSNTISKVLRNKIIELFEIKAKELQIITNLNSKISSGGAPPPRAIPYIRPTCLPSVTKIISEILELAKNENYGQLVKNYLKDNFYIYKPDSSDEVFKKFSRLSLKDVKDILENLRNTIKSKSQVLNEPQSYSMRNHHPLVSDNMKKYFFHKNNPISKLYEVSSDIYDKLQQYYQRYYLAAPIYFKDVFKKMTGGKRRLTYKKKTCKRRKKCSNHKYRRRKYRKRRRKTRKGQLLKKKATKRRDSRKKHHTRKRRNR